MEPQIDPEELARQLRKPTGAIGLQVGTMMNSFNRPIYEDVLKLLHLKNSDHLIELGFGNGHFLGEYFRLNSTITVTGIDYSASMCDEAAKFNKTWIEAGKLRILNENAASTSVPDESADFLIALNNIYFWHPVEDYIREIHRMLKKNGSLILGFSPARNMQDEFYKNGNFLVYEAENVINLVRPWGFSGFSVSEHPVSIELIDGKILETSDICLITQKI